MIWDDISILALIISFLITWSIGLLPPIALRYGLLKRPFSRSAALGIVSMFWVINLVIFSALGSESRTHIALILIAYISYLILIHPSVQAQTTDSRRMRNAIAVISFAYVLFGFIVSGWLFYTHNSDHNPRLGANGEYINPYYDLIQKEFMEQAEEGGTNSNSAMNADLWVGRYKYDYMPLLRERAASNTAILEKLSDSYSLAISIKSNFCSGDFYGAGIVEGDHIIFADQHGCHITVNKPSASSLVISEAAECQGWHGFECSFNGNYESIPGPSAPRPEQHLSISRQLTADKALDPYLQTVKEERIQSLKELACVIIATGAAMAGGLLLHRLGSSEFLRSKSIRAKEFAKSFNDKMRRTHRLIIAASLFWLVFVLIRTADSFEFLGYELQKWDDSYLLLNLFAPPVVATLAYLTYEWIAGANKIGK